MEDARRKKAEEDARIQQELQRIRKKAEERRQREEAEKQKKREEAERIRQEVLRERRQDEAERLEAEKTVMGEESGRGAGQSAVAVVVAAVMRTVGPPFRPLLRSL